METNIESLNSTIETINQVLLRKLPTEVYESIEQYKESFWNSPVSFGEENNALMDAISYLDPFSLPEGEYERLMDINTEYFS